MTASIIRRSHAPRAGGVHRLPPGEQVNFETLLYTVGGALLVLALSLLGWMNLKGRAAGSEPLVVWKNEQPAIIREALSAEMRGELVLGLRAEGMERTSPDTVRCGELAASWFEPVPDPFTNRGPAARGLPLSCEWTPGVPEVVVIHR
jgi:hypothetical protein